MAEALLTETRPTTEEVLTVLRQALPELSQRFAVTRLAVFGSVARGDQTPVSDVDILVDVGKPLGWEIVTLHDYLQETLGVQVDLVTEDAVRRKPLLWRSIREDLLDVEA